MKKKILYLILFFLLLGVVGCDKPEPPIIPGDIDVVSVAIDKTYETLYVGDKLQLKVSVLPSNATDKTITWSSSNDEIATVTSAGLVKAISAGTAIITAESHNGKTATMTVNVVQEEELPEGVIFDTDFDSPVMPKNFVINNGGGGNAYISDGLLNMATVGQGTASASVLFDEALYGTVVVETKIKVNKPAFTNALYFYTSGTSTSDIVAAVAFENSDIKYHDGSGWKNLMKYNFEEWYELTMVLHIGERLDGSDKGNFDLTINDVVYKNLPFRNGGDGKEDNIWRLYLASEKSNSEFAYDYLRIYQIDLPKIQLSSYEGSADLTINPTYEFDYVVTGVPTPEVKITADKPAGYTLDGNVVTFSAAGTYVFTITATNQGGSVSEQVVIEVTGDVVAPLINIIEKEKLIFLSRESEYILQYEVTAGNPAPEIEITCNKDSGYTINGNEISFTEAGQYHFTISGTNTGGTVSDTVKVIVLDNESVLAYDFEEMPGNLEIDTAGAGSVTILDGNLNIKASGSTNYGFVQIPFGHKLKDVVILETRVKVNSQAFSNIIYFAANNNNNDRAVTIGMHEGKLKVHDERTWINVTDIIDGEYYEIVAILDINNATYDLFLDGVKLGTYPFRNEQFKDDITHFHLGADKEGADIYYDYLKLSYVTTPEIVVNEAEATLEFTENITYTLDYVLKDSYPQAQVTILGEPLVGYTIEDNLVRFTKPGTYTFTITASNVNGTDSKTITVNVVGLDAEPTVSVEVDEIKYDLNNLDPLILAYKVTGYPEPEVTITAEPATGFNLVGNTVTFTEAGTYVFTITATNVHGTDSKTIIVEVENPEKLPQIAIAEVFHHDMTKGALEVEFVLTGNPVPSFEITTEADAVIDGKLITFATPGTYHFTITATNSLGSVSKDFTVEVVALYAPEISVNEDYKELNIAIDPTYTLDYSVSGTPEITTVITVSEEEGFVLNGNLVGFTLPGTYVFTIKATNLKGEDVKTIIVEVIEPENGNYIYYNDFEELPTTGFTFTNGATAEIVDGALKMSTTNQGVAKLALDFDSYLSGTVAVKTRVKASGSASGNIIFLYSGSTNVLGLLIDNYKLRYHNGQGWTDVGFTFQEDKWVEVMAVVTLGSGVFDLYVDGHKFADLSLRSPGEAEYTINNISNIGVDSRSNVNMYYDYYQVYNLDPVITVEEESIGTSLDDPVVSLGYQVSSGLDTEVTITSESEEGYEIAGNQITFFKAGTYVFTITATNEFGTTTKDVTIIVSEAYIDPEITVLEDAAEVDLAGYDYTYTFKYETNVAVPTATLTITCDATEGFDLSGDTVRFSLLGTYTFTLTYTNDRATDVKTIVVSVIESEVTKFVEEDFDSSNEVPEGLEALQSGSGNITVLSDVEGANGNVLNLRTGSSSGEVDVNKHFASPLSGIVVVKTRFMVGSDAFSNVLFFKSDSATVACIAFEKGFIRYHAGGGWTNSNVPYEFFTWYELKVVLNTETAKFDLYVDSKYIGNFGFRTPSQKNNITHLNLASNKQNTDMYYDYLEIYNVPQVIVTESEATISLADGTYELAFDVLGKVEPVEITCDATEGWMLEDRTVTFTEAGTYVFTVTAKNGALSSFKTITVFVSE